MNTLFDGHRRFKNTTYPPLSERFDELGGGQSPHTLFVTCSDSRVDPSLITSTEPGELFMLRNVGNLVPPYGDDDASAASVEYAVDALGVKEIVVCGHSGCGAMGGLLSPEAVESVPTVARWIEHAAPTREAIGSAAEPDALNRAVAHNADTQLSNLMTHPSVARAVEAGRLTLSAWVYDIPSGDIAVGGAR